MLKIHKPFTLVFNLLSNKIRQVSIRVVDPAAWVPAVLDQNEAFARKEKGEVPKDTFFLFKQNLELHFRAEDNLVTGNKAQVAHPDHLRVS